MKSRIIYPLIIVLMAIFWDGVTSMSLILVALIVINWFVGGWTGFGLAAVLGWVGDLKRFSWVGETAIYFLLVALVVQMVKLQTGSKDLGWMLGIVVLATLGWQYMTGASWSVGMIVGHALAATVVWAGFRYFIRSDGVYLR